MTTAREADEIEIENERERAGDRGNSAHEFNPEDQGYHKTLRPRQIQMIAIGGAIGTGRSSLRVGRSRHPDRG